MRFAFLLYVPRSGSTLFARLISEQIDDIVVLPEFRMAEWLLSRSESSLSRMIPAELHELMLLDHQRHNLGLSDADYLAVAQETAGQGAARILSAIVRRYLRKRGFRLDPDRVLIKLASLLHLLPTVQKQFPDATFLHIVRDPRGVVNSQIHNDRPYFPSERLGRGDPWFAAKFWRNYLRKVHRFQSRGAPILTVQYEQLILNPTEVMARTTAFLGLPEHNPTGDEYGRVTFEVSEPEQAIHHRVEHTLQAGRGNAWRGELSLTQGCVVECLVGKPMLGLGYESYYLPLLARYQVVLMFGRSAVWHIWCTQAYYARRAVQYMKQWRKVPARFVLGVRRVCDRPRNTN